MNEIKKPAGSQLAAAVDELKDLLRSWQPPAGIKSPVNRTVWASGSGAGLVCEARIELIRRETTKTPGESLTRAWSLTFRLRVGGGFDPEDLAGRLDAVAVALGRGLGRAGRVAAEAGFEVVATRSSVAAAPRWVPRVLPDLPPVPYDPLMPGIAFRRVPGWGNYEVSRCGIVRSYYDLGSGTIAEAPQRILQPQGKGAGQPPSVTLFRGKYGTNSHQWQVFTQVELVARAWGGST